MIEGLHITSLILGFLIAIVVLSIGGYLIVKFKMRPRFGDSTEMLDVDKEKFDESMRKLKEYAEEKEEDEEED